MQVDRAAGENPEIAKKINSDGNLLKLLLSGFAFKCKVDIPKKYKKQMKKRMLSVLCPQLAKNMSDRLPSFILAALSGVLVKVKLSPAETYSVFKTQFQGLDLPDAVDLLDEMGMLANADQWIEYYDDFPFLAQLVDTLHDVAACQIEVGYTSIQRTMSLKFKTEGIKELVDLILAGCS